METISLSPVIDLAPHLSPGQTIFCPSVGPRGEILLMLAPHSHDIIEQLPNSPIVPKPTPIQPKAAQILALWPNSERYTVTLVNFPPVQYNLHHAQCTADGWLLVGARARTQSPEGPEHNGFLFSTRGELQKTFAFNDAIEDVHVATSGTIWTSYFDESASCTGVGLVAWNPDGTQRYSFEPREGLELIDDCYALNVVSDHDTWFYYYSPFHLVHLHDFVIADHWTMPVSGSHCFAIYDQYAMFGSGYTHGNYVHLFALEANSRVRELKTFQIHDEIGENLLPCPQFARSDTMYFLKNDRLYRLKIGDLFRQAR